MMSAQAFTQRLLSLDKLDAQKAFMDKEAVKLVNNLFSDEVATALKAEADRLLGSDIQRVSDLAELLILMESHTQNPLHKALGLRSKANVECMSRANYQATIDLCDQAAQLYHEAELSVEEANSQMIKIVALSHLGKHEQAGAVGDYISNVLQRYEQWLPLARLYSNLASTVYGRRSKDAQALALLEKARALYEQFGADKQAEMALIDLNRSISLRYLGRFEASIVAAQQAWQSQQALGQHSSAALSQQSLANTYLALGHYNETLKILEQARDTFLADQRQHDALWVELFATNCLLALHRFANVLEKCRQIREQFSSTGAQWEMAQVILNEATAHIGMNSYGDALRCIEEAKGIFEEEGNQLWLHIAQLEVAVVRYHQNRLEESLSTALASAKSFQTTEHQLNEAHAYLVAARAALALARPVQTAALLKQAEAIGRVQALPSILYQVYHLFGRVAELEHNFEQAFHEYEQSIRQIERLRRRVMVEFRADFQSGKQVVYEDMVALCLRQKRLLQGLDYAERAKSRALVDLLAYRLDLRIQSKASGDTALIAQLEALQSERDQHYRRWASSETHRITRPSHEQEQRASSLEKQILDLWHKLLVRNADYAQDAALQQVHTEPVQPYIATDTLLIEFFVIKSQFVIFLVTREEVKIEILPNSVAEVQEMIQFWQLNMETLPRYQAQPVLRAASLKNAHNLLKKLYQILLKPIQSTLQQYPNLIIVPHSTLHYLPFHALHSGESFLIETHEISYLPNASLLRYCYEERLKTGSAAFETALQAHKESNDATNKAVVFAYSNEGALPHTTREARSIALLMNATVYREEQATLAQFQQSSPSCRLIHLATHGLFQADNPLFSGVTLADGMLTTLKIFNLRLNASLVTLSACETGQHVVGGGDELLGLMRAFLYAGTASILLSLWKVDDRATVYFMKSFYKALSQGKGKAAALRHTQRQFLKGAIDSDYTHPYYWAPFFLTGDPGVL